MQYQENIQFGLHKEESRMFEKLEFPNAKDKLKSTKAIEAVAVASENLLSLKDLNRSIIFPNGSYQFQNKQRHRHRPPRNNRFTQINFKEQIHYTKANRSQ
jgi:hypothetical protein